jgi:RNA polymerase sigma-70 factor (ECF subfamily)
MDPFWLIYERYNRDVYRFALFLTGDASRADDLVSDTFVRAWTARGRIQQETVKGYLLTIATQSAPRPAESHPPIRGPGRNDQG